MALAYVAGQSVSSFSLLPGGLGVADTAVIVALIHGGGAAVHATAAVVLYRLVGYAFNAALGWVLWAANRHRENRHRSPAARPDAGLRPSGPPVSSAQIGARSTRPAARLQARARAASTADRDRRGWVPVGRTSLPPSGLRASSRNQFRGRYELDLAVCGRGRVP